MHFDNKVVVRTDILTQRVAFYTVVVKRLDGWRRHLVRKYRPPRRPHCIRRVPSALQKGHSTFPLLGPCLLWPRSSVSATAELLLQIVASIKDCNMTLGAIFVAAGCFGFWHFVLSGKWSPCWSSAAMVVCRWPTLCRVWLSSDQWTSWWS